MEISEDPLSARACARGESFRGDCVFLSGDGMRDVPLSMSWLCCRPWHLL